MRCILIVEDEPLVRLLLDDVLSGSGYEVITAATAEAGIAAIDAKSSALAGLVTDIELGDRTSGWEVARYARSLNPDLRVVYISGNRGAEWLSQGVPASVFIQKPLVVKKLLSALAPLLSDSSEHAA